MFAVRSLLPGLLLALPSVAMAQRVPVPDADPRIQKLVASVSEQRLRDLNVKLASFATRSTLSDATSTTRGIGAARQWMLEELKRSSPRLQVSFDTHRIAPQGRITREVELRNVMAVLPGKSPRRVYITGHYDTVNLGGGGQLALNAGAGANPQASREFNHDVDAPGANDDGSGTVLTMELARVFAESGIEFDATLVFMCWAGEEQGLIGSTAHAQQLAADQVVVEANFNNDIIGNIQGGGGLIDGESVRVYSLGPEDSMNRALARYIQRVAATYVPSHGIRLMAREDRFGRGSDHSSFTSFGFPAVVFREANENYSRQHTANDTVGGVNFAYLAQNTRVNAAGAASVALAPPAPKVTGPAGQALVSRNPSGYDATLQWAPSPGAAGYRIYWRDTWNNSWERSQVVGNVTQFTLAGLSIDDWVFGVAAIGADGAESLVSAYVSPTRRVNEVKLVK
ncbi:MAG: M20/M25/M40 family metallo-hydrolase [Cytophagaceae bacterium]|nr:M20/M25/M40 family metallo-hydrolase [Gemmatimonadaceae bacterium]